MDDRDLALAVARRAAPWLPTLLAMSGSSPFWLGTDTGYASYRTLIWRRWPTAGPLPGFDPAADYDRTVTDLIRSGVITDPGMIYFDIRPSAHLPTLELRISDSCTRLEEVVLPLLDQPTAVQLGRGIARYALRGTPRLARGPVDKKFFYVKTDFCHERRRLPRRDRAG